jgi:uncharacterized membrane protein
MRDKSAVKSRKPLSVDQFRKQRKPLSTVSVEIPDKLNSLDRIACWITDRVGSMGFFLIVLIWTAAWLGWNLLAPRDLQFDPPTAFVFWLFISNVIQLLLMPLIMVGQNIQGRHSEIRAKQHLEMIVNTERETEAILQQFRYQNAILIAMMEKLGVSFDNS